MLLKSGFDQILKCVSRICELHPGYLTALLSGHSKFPRALVLSDKS